MEYKIKKATPEMLQKLHSKNYKYPVDKLAVNEYFEISLSERSKAATFIYRLMKNDKNFFGKKFSTMVISDTKGILIRTK